MYKVMFTGQNASLHKYGVRFEAGKIQLIEDTDLAEKLKEEKNFKVEPVVGTSPAPVLEVDKQPTLTALKEKAKEAKISGYSTMDKEQLIEALAVLESDNKEPAALQANDPYADAPTV
ncbi:Rho termination factor N-terminal domain-containing protein [Paenibacillus kandeliae]|uniref:Rho termination factor N-terminal domain-containing protein n=1 Tax=Paenibacillus kandeliae TaxID=3231269 RepID=UPI003458A0F6